MSEDTKYHYDFVLVSSEACRVSIEATFVRGNALQGLSTCLSRSVDATVTGTRCPSSTGVYGNPWETFGNHLD